MVLDVGEGLQIVHGRQVETAAVLEDIPAEEDAAAAFLVVVVAEHGQAAFDVEADLRLGPGPVLPQAAHAGDDGSVAGTLTELWPAVKLFRSIKYASSPYPPPARAPRSAVHFPPPPA